jgi:hypothetical protein
MAGIGPSLGNLPRIATHLGLLSMVWDYEYFAALAPHMALHSKLQVGYVLAFV